MDVKFVDTTFRDGSQSLWASGMRSGMMEAVAADMDQAGFEVVQPPPYVPPCRRVSGTGGLMFSA